ncbi:MAG TPA: hydrogenase maturation nickel metallochaperone HypA, partial [Kiritimatiellia bacterium]|nr:hydrogenase maturation nickel metallochaperone HypA [Kiritimatiellia bacterium]
MHEFGIAQGLLETVLAKARDIQAARIDTIALEIGVLCGVDQSALVFAFTALAEGTPAAGATLKMESIPLRCYCSQCRTDFECKPFQYKCPDCGANSSTIRSGREMNLISMEVT